MPFVANFPLFCIVLTLAGSVTTSVLNGKNAFRLNTVIISLCLVMNFSLLVYLVTNPQQITYMMGHFPAPWGNETRFGPVEALIATIFCVVMLLSLIQKLYKEYHTLDMDEIMTIVRKESDH